MCPESSTIPWRRMASGGVGASVQVSGQLHTPFALSKDDAQVPIGLIDPYV
jgi:hypothetical protein